MNRMMHRSTFLKTTAGSGLIAALLAITTGCATTPGYNDYGDVYKDIYKDSSVYKKNKKHLKSIDKQVYQPAIEQKAANKVRSMGYRVQDVKYNQGKRTIKVKAERGRQNYKIELGYPRYNVLNIKKN